MKMVMKKKISLGSGEMVPRVSCLPWRPEDLSLTPRTHIQPGTEAHISNPSIPKAR